MDKADAQAAFSISHGNPGSFSWDATGKVMTFTPGAPLPYGANVIAGVSHTASDLEGKQMAGDYSFKFRVLRKFTTTLYGQAGYDGHVFAPPVMAVDRVVEDDAWILVTTWARGFLSFDLSGLPENLVEILSADLSVYQLYATAGAYGPQTGNLLIQSVTYGALDAGDFSKGKNCSWLCLIDPVLSDSAALGWKTAHVVGWVRGDWNLRAERGERSQFRLLFQTENAGAGPAEGVGFYSGDSAVSKPKLVITYTAP
jgi:hypothetical protein